MDELKLIDTKELAQILGKSPRTIKRWKKQGKLPPPGTGFGKDYWTVKQIRIWLDQKGLFATMPQNSD